MTKNITLKLSLEDCQDIIIALSFQQENEDPAAKEFNHSCKQIAIKMTKEIEKQL